MFDKFIIFLPNRLNIEQIDVGCICFKKNEKNATKKIKNGKGKTTTIKKIKIFNNSFIFIISMNIICLINL